MCSVCDYSAPVHWRRVYGPRLGRGLLGTRKRLVINQDAWRTPGTVWTEERGAWGKGRGVGGARQKTGPTQTLTAVLCAHKLNRSNSTDAPQPPLPPSILPLTHKYIPDQQNPQANLPPLPHPPHQPPLLSPPPPVEIASQATHTQSPPLTPPRPADDA